MSEEVLFSNSSKTGTHYEETVEAEELEETDPLLEYKVALYMKVGLFFGWSWQDFDKTDILVTKRLAEEIDFRLMNLDSEQMFINYDSIGMLMAIAKAFGGKKSE